jgi:hypothetical protein
LAVVLGAVVVVAVLVIVAVVLSAVIVVTVLIIVAIILSAVVVIAVLIVFVVIHYIFTPFLKNQFELLSKKKNNIHPN